MKELYVIIDMQNDFVTGALENAAAAAIVPDIISRLSDAKARGAALAVTRDTHGGDYLQTQEGRRLPVPHCIKGTPGHEIISALQPHIDGFGGVRVFDKPAFGSTALGEYVRDGRFDRVTLMGVCTDICVISNAFVIKAFAPETEVAVIADCCAGVTPGSHETALAAMSAAQIDII